jgi:hypothetical protein
MSTIIWEDLQQIPLLQFNEDTVTVSLDPILLSELRISMTREPLIIFCRPQVHDLFKFLDDDVKDQGFYGSICGPPGTGKSVAAMAYACSLDRNEWTVTFISLRRKGGNIVTQIDFTGIKSFAFDDSQCDLLDKFLAENILTPKHFIFLDGYVENRGSHNLIQNKCEKWFEDDLYNKGGERRRLVTVCSMSSLDFRVEEEDTHKEKDFFMFSWTMEDYERAIDYEPFYQSIKSKLDAVVSADKHQLLLAKHYLGGGCARYVFGSNTEKVRKGIEAAVQKANDLNLLVTAAQGERSNSVVNRILAKYKDR